MAFFVYPVLAPDYYCFPVSDCHIPGVPDGQVPLGQRRVPKTVDGPGLVIIIFLQQGVNIS